MKEFPILSQDSRSRDITTQFGGLNEKLDCGEGEFMDMENMTSKYFPMLSPRDALSSVSGSSGLTEFQGMLGKEDLIVVANNNLYINFIRKDLPYGMAITDGRKTLETMGSRVLIFPDKLMYDRESNTWTHMNAYSLTVNSTSFQLCDGNVAIINAQPSSYYDTHDPANGAYKYDKNLDGNGNWLPCTYYKYSEQTSAWLPCNNLRYRMMTNSVGYGLLGFKNGDTVKMSLATISSSDPVGKTMFPDGKSYVKIEFEGDGFILYCTFPNITSPSFTTSTLAVEREVPALDFVTEYNNRLWGVEADGHEIWACKLGDPTNWNAFEGISTDSWRATVGSEGVFTGAITYSGYPTMFKENSLIKIAVSSTGAHSYKEVFLEGVKWGETIREIANVLYYMGERGIYAYNGGAPVCISEKISLDSIHGSYFACAGDIGGRYYICIHNQENLPTSHEKTTEYVYDVDKGIWMKRTASVSAYAKYGDALIDYEDGAFYTVDDDIRYGDSNGMEWFAESGHIGYYDADHKYVLRMSVRLSVPSAQYVFERLSDTNEASVSFYIEYDSSGEWEHIFTVSDIGTKTFTMPIRPKRCDHFRYRIEGRGIVRIISITKTVAGGSDK